MRLLLRTVEDLLLLGIDTSGKTASAALFDSDSETFLAQTSLYTQKTHSQVIMPAVKEMIAQAGKQITDIGGIAVANGPGSYTGLRIGVAAAKAMSFGQRAGCEVKGAAAYFVGITFDVVRIGVDGVSAAVKEYGAAVDGCL